MTTLKNPTVKKFKEIIWDYYKSNKRSFAWRDVENPYYVVVSEIMLQQTQTYRVISKFEEFISYFPDFKSLATAPRSLVIRAWQGLGYNRRAIALHIIAQKIMDEYGGILPSSEERLMKFPGIGKATAASICTFAFNKPTIFIETNIRTVFIHFFFHDQEEIHDKELLTLIEKTIDKNEPRQWYYALMDYGVMLKKKLPNPSRKSRHHANQSKFEGSFRQIRGKILKILSYRYEANFDEFCSLIDRESNLIEKALSQLNDEGFIQEKNSYFSLAP